jgi:dUTP pyrophosphatase
MTGIAGVYFAYPIDQRGPSSLVHMFQQVERLKTALLDAQLIDWAYDPGDAFKVRRGALPTDKIGRINRVALIAADLVVAFLPAGVASIGVPIEIDRAVAHGKRVIVFSDAQAWMLEYPGKQIIRYIDWDDDSLKDAVLEIARMEAPEEQRPREDLPVYSHHGDEAMPVRAYDDDAGLDLIVTQDTLIQPGEFVDVPCGISVELPEWAWGLVTGRSSALRKKGLLIHSGVIDAGYRGPLFAGAWNMTDEPVTVKSGERVAQLIVLSNMTRHVQPVRVPHLSPSLRGQNGFGSTGA